MKLVKLQLLAVAASLTFVNMATAQIYFTGSFGFTPWGDSGAYSSSSLTLAPVNVINTVAATGTFSTLLYDGLSGYATTLTGLSSSPTPENVPNYFVFASVSPISPSLGNGGNGNEYSFTLTSLTESSSGNFSGTGMLIDANNVLADTPATFSLSFSSSYNYAASLAATPVPEPATMTLLAGATLLGLSRRRKG